MTEQIFVKLLKLKEGQHKGWHVESVDLDENAQKVTVYITYDETVCRCPEPGCGAVCKVHDTRRQECQGLDTYGCKTFLNVGFPRVRCPEHGVQAAKPPFIETGSFFTTAFEKQVIKLCKGAPVKKVAQDLGINWHTVARIKKAEADRLTYLEEQRPAPRPRVLDLGIDETSFQKYHDYLTVLTDGGSGRVLDVLPGRDAGALKQWFSTQCKYDFSGLRSVSMDMAPPYIKAVRESFPQADQIICYDRFHVAQLFSRALDAVRRKESARFNRAGSENPLAKTRFDWLRNNERTDNRTARRRRFHALRRGALKNTKTAKVWELKEQASRLWERAKGRDARGEWKRLL